MDVIGVDPISERGAHFRCHLWGWPPLWQTVSALAPSAASPHAHDGDGLDASGSRAVAERIDQALNSGEADTYVRVVRAQCRAAGLPEVISIDDLKAFRDFLRECGGFQVH
ncbi:hypothetical protein CKO15_06160 [Halorhodospira abdelmalekii]|uniref:hypothetical protein n=1 Tax=Halorhodospira abdelmalekii TaxID=421629 RepID=UPI00190489D4|nr:hypothetical protein [Halorhodospira abdelmalekii]MBK1734880.1 hypothetical protein [Halorhodospira abdelmalekii]